MLVDNNWSVIKLTQLYDPTELVEDIPWERGNFTYVRPGVVNVQKDEGQVNGSFSRYNHPKFKKAFYHIKNVVESVIGEKVYPTYYFDRFYFKGNELVKHRDREACEISVSYHIWDNLDYEWPIYFQADNDPKPCEITCKPGDGVLYRGMQLDHWREPMRGNHKSCFHQVFLHYVRANGYCLHHAFDRHCE